nr:MAG TPA: hypothetical protein [Ackermannviridae sp.]
MGSSVVFICIAPFEGVIESSPIIALPAVSSVNL